MIHWLLSSHEKLRNIVPRSRQTQKIVQPWVCEVRFSVYHVKCKFIIQFEITMPHRNTCIQLNIQYTICSLHCVIVSNDIKCLFKTFSHKAILLENILINLRITNTTFIKILRYILSSYIVGIQRY